VVDVPKPGSLVLYFSNALEANSPTLMHTALYQGDGIVQSKMGIAYGVYEHRMEDAFAYHGRLILFAH
jgi:hypothetical protein